MNRLWTLCWVWSSLGIACDYQEENDVDYHLIPHRQESSLIKELERHKFNEIQGKLANVSFTHSIYKSSFQELDITFRNIQTSNTLIKDYLQTNSAQASQPTGENPQSQAPQKLLQLVHRLGSFSNHPTTHSPLATNLKQVPHFFTGMLAEDQCKGLFSGMAKYADVVQKNNTLIFALMIDKQLFQGELTSKDIHESSIMILKSKHSSNQIAFHLAPELYTHWTDVESVRSAWKNLLGLKTGNWPVTFYAPSLGVPDGIEVIPQTPSPLSVTYSVAALPPENAPPSCQERSLWETFVVWLFGEEPPKPQPVRYAGTVTVTDTLGGSRGKVLTQDYWGKELVFEMLEGTIIKIHPTFDFQKNWNMPLIAWDHFQLRMVPTLHFRQSEFDANLNESVAKFDARPLYQDLQTILLGYLASQRQQKDIIKTNRDLSDFSFKLGQYLKTLEQRKNDLQKLINNNESDIQEMYLEGKMLLSKMTSKTSLLKE